MGRRLFSTTVYLEPYQQTRLKEISDVTNVPMSEYIRQGIDVVLERLKDIAHAGPVPAEPGPTPDPTVPNE